MIEFGIGYEAQSFVGNVNLVFLKQRALGDQKVLLFFILLMVLQEMCQFQFICEVFKVIIGKKYLYVSELTNRARFYKRRKSAEKFKMVTTDGSYSCPTRLSSREQRNIA